MNKYQLVHQMGEVVARGTDAWEGLRQAAKLSREAVECDACIFYSYAEEQKLFILEVQCGLSKADFPEGKSFSVEQGSFEMLLATARAVNVRNQANLLNPLFGNSLHGMLTVPLIAGGRVIGAMEFVRKAARKFSESHQALAQEVALPLAVFIINQQLLRRQKDSSSDRGEAFLPAMLPVAGRDTARFVSLKGKTLSPGSAFGHALLLSGIEDLQIGRNPVPVLTKEEEIQPELQLMEKAMNEAKQQCQNSAEELQKTLSEADASIFSMHAMMMEDPTLHQMLEKSIREGHSLQNALRLALRTYTQQYGQIEDEYLRERLYDIKDVLLTIRNAAKNLQKLPEESGAATEKSTEKRNKKQAEALASVQSAASHLILVAHELLPSQLIAQPLKKVTGILCEDGGATSHIAILARALKLPMLIGIPGVRDVIAPGETVLLDCQANASYAGECLIHPSLDQVRKYAAPLRVSRDHQEACWKKAAGRRVDCCKIETADGAELHMQANIALLNEMAAIPHYGIEGVGLYRTEFMFMIRNGLPTEEEQFQLFCQILEAAKGAPVTLRALDAGGDKPLPYLNRPVEDNPALGLRGFRFLMRYRNEILLPHLRAMLRASRYGKLRILFPMIADQLDALHAKEALEEAKAQLISRGEPFDARIPMGVMLEIPSACEGVETLIPFADFFCLGTNDLLQYLFAVDRGNPGVAKWYKQCHPLLLQNIRSLCEKLKVYPTKELCVCGELGGSITGLPLLLGCGVRHFSMVPARVPMLRDLAKKYTIPQCEELLRDVLDSCRTDQEVRQYLKSRQLV